MQRVGKNPVWSRWACPITTASRSSSVIFSESNLGYASIGDFAPGFTPQSIKILLSGVDSNIEDRPTWPNPPKVKRETSDLWASLGRKISSPISLNCLLLSVDDCLRVALMVCMVLDGTVVAFLTRIFQPVFSVTSAWLNSLAFRWSSHGLFASTDTSPVAVSKMVPWRLASSGTQSVIIFLASSSGFLIDSSVRITIRFLIIFTRFEIVSLFSKRYVGEFV